MRDYGLSIGVALVIICGDVWPAAAQQWPLPIETVAGAGAGNVSLEIGADYTRAVRFTLSGLQGNLWRVALVRIDIGLSQIADFELSGGLRDHLQITSTSPAAFSQALQLTDPTSTGAFDDIIVGTKVRVVAEESWRPGLAVRVATRLPNAKHPSGLGQNTTDFFATLVVIQSVASTRITGNIGLGILGDPLQGNRRVDSTLYGLAVHHEVTGRTTFVVSIDGRSGSTAPGLEPRALGAAGLMWTTGPMRVEGDCTLGLTRRDGNVGAAVKATFTWHVFGS